MDHFTETLRSWHNFYFMAGGATATLVGLMFVALSLGRHLVSEETRAEFTVFVAPSIIYFTSALILSCVMLVPQYDPNMLAGILVVGGLIGLINTLPAARKLMRAAFTYQDFDIPEWLFQIILPPMSYIFIGLAGVALVLDFESATFTALWAADIMLIVSAISNTWSMVMWIIDQHD